MEYGLVVVELVRRGRVDMKNINYLDIDLVLYHNDKPVNVCKLDYIGLMGMHVKGHSLTYPKNSPLEIEVLGPYKTSIDNSRVPVVVSSNDDEGIGLRLKSYDDELVQSWVALLSEVYSSFKNGKCKYTASAN